MPITRLNHAVLYVADLDRSVRFYTDVMGFRAIPMAPEGFRAAFLQAPGSINDHDLGLFEIGSQAAPSAAGRSTVGLYHHAWEVDTLAELERQAGVLTDPLTGLGNGAGWVQMASAAQARAAERAVHGSRYMDRPLIVKVAAG